jgi:hypothetical protein
MRFFFQIKLCNSFIKFFVLEEKKLYMNVLYSLCFLKDKKNKILLKYFKKHISIYDFLG